MLLRDRIKKELDKIKAANGGSLPPQAIVDFARDEKTALHSQFDWEDSDAARKWRLEQARRVVQIHVTVTEEGSAPVRAFISLSTDRREGRGYRALEDVLSDEAFTKQMLEDALSELNATRRKYKELKALAGVWDAVDQVVEKPAPANQQPAVAA